MDDWVLEYLDHLQDFFLNLEIIITHFENTLMSNHNPYYHGFPVVEIPSSLNDHAIVNYEDRSYELILSEHCPINMIS